MSTTHLADENGVLAAHSARDGDTHTLRLSGELDLASYDLLNDELRRVEETDASTIVIDLSGLTFLDSAGIRLLVEADARSRADGARLQLIPGGDQVRRTLQLCGLEESLPFVSENGLAGSASGAPRPMRPAS